jgi:fructose-1,6-bisphosphatase/sedoheptulose 1,7-bisphosphatase-like protein
MRDAIIILASKSKYSGMVTMVKLNGSVEGVITAAAIRIMTNACRRYCLKNRAETIPILVSKLMSKGS